MPTGYTQELEDMDYDVKGWLKTKVVRAFGLFAHLRDDYEDKDVKALERSLERTRSIKPEEPVEPDYNLQYLESVKRWREIIAEKKAGKLKWEKALAEVKMMLDNSTVGSLSNSVLQMAYDQLKVIESDYDYSYYEEKLLEPVAKVIESLKRDYQYKVEYYQKKLEEWKQKKEDLGVAPPVSVYRLFCSDIDRLMEKTNAIHKHQ